MNLPDWCHRGATVELGESTIRLWINAGGTAGLIGSDEADRVVFGQGKVYTGVFWFAASYFSGTEAQPPALRVVSGEDTVAEVPLSEIPTWDAAVAWMRAVYALHPKDEGGDE